MRAIKYRELKRMYESMGPAPTVRHLGDALREGQLAPEDFSLREIAEAFVGPEWVRSMDPRRGSLVMEVGDGVDSTAFSNITGQIIYSKILQAYQNEAFVLSGLVQTIPTRLDGEKIPGITNIKESDAVKTVGEGMPYASAGFGEDYIETPSTTKRGFIVPVTKEAIFFDRTGQVLQRASQVGEALGLNKEKRIIDTVIGGDNTYKWKGTTYDTYSDDGTTGAAGGTAWGGINQHTNELVDWTDVDAAEQLFNNMTDPETSDPILITGSTVLVTPAYAHAAARVFNATELEYGADTGTVRTRHANPLAGYSFKVSRLFYARLVAKLSLEAASAKKYWLLGDFNRAFAYMENWPITVVQAPQNNEAEFERDIVARYKTSERGVAAVMDPRYMTRSTGAA